MNRTEVAPVLVENILPGSDKAILILANGEKMKLENSDSLQVDLGAGNQLVNKDNQLVYQGEETGELQYNELQIPRGGEYQVKLADGTIVRLNSGSSLRYPVAFGKEKREVVLKGEAYFQVAHDRQKAFVVVTDDIEVKVYGTEFNINTRVADYVQTTLVRGAVSIKTERSAEKMLKPGQLAQFDRLTGETEIKNVDVSNYIGWKSGVYIFEDKSIEQIMDELSLWYDIEVFFRNNISRNRHFSGSLPRYREIDDMLKVIEKTSHVRFEVKGKTIIVD